jgi:hypothetical protein
MIPTIVELECNNKPIWMNFDFNPVIKVENGVTKVCFSVKETPEEICRKIQEAKASD